MNSPEITEQEMQYLKIIRDMHVDLNNLLKRPEIVSNPELYELAIKPYYRAGLVKNLQGLYMMEFI